MIRGNKLINKKIKRLRRELIHSAGCTYNNCATHAEENITNYIELCVKYKKKVRVPRSLCRRQS